MASVLDSLEAQIASLLSHSQDSAETARKIYQQLVAISEESLQTPSKRAHLHYLKGKVSNIINASDPAIEQHLSKAIKLNPRLVDAWETLAEHYYATHQFEKAFQNFQNAISQQRDHNGKGNSDDNTNNKALKVLLRKLSMAQRRIGSNPEETRKNTEESVKHARDAVALDLNDGDSWYVLGNALLASFFITPSFGRIGELQKALAAYAKASTAAVISEDNKKDLFFNRSMVHTFMGNYDEALEGFSAAAASDSNWREPVQARQSLTETVTRISSLIEKKCSMKPKQIATAIKALPQTASALPVPLNTKAQLLNFATLKEGANLGCALPVVVSGFGSASAEVPLVLVCVDNQGEFAAVSVYNLNRDVVQYGSTLLILDPILARVKLVDSAGFAGKSWMNVRVESVTKMLIDGKAVGPNAYRAPELAVTTNVSAGSKSN